MGGGKVAQFRRRWWFGADPCVYCGQLASTADHIRAKSRGGRDDWPNMAPCCRVCNSQRGNRPLLVWLLVLDLKRRGKEAARRWQSRTLEFTKRDERAKGLHQEQWKHTATPAAVPAPEEP